MAGEQNNAAAAIDVDAIVKKVSEGVLAATTKLIGDAVGPLSKAMGDLAQNQKIFGDTFDAKLKELAPPAGGDKGAGKDKGADGAVKALTADDVLKILNDRDEKNAATATQTALRNRFVEDLRGKKVPDEVINAHLPAAGDEAAYKTASEKVVGRWNELAGTKLPNQGGATKDGGTPPGQGGGDAAADRAKAMVAKGVLPPGQAKFATSIASELAALNARGG